jgi:hypothetical protein
MVPPVEIDTKNGQATPAICAVRTGPTGRTILLPTDEVVAYEALVESINQKFEPETFQEKLLAQSIVDCEWRLRRIAGLEEALAALARRELAAKHRSEPDPQRRVALIDTQLPTAHQNHFKNLAQQRRYLRKLLKTDSAELNQLLRDRRRPTRNGLFLVPKRDKR